MERVVVNGWPPSPVGCYSEVTSACHYSGSGDIAGGGWAERRCRSVDGDGEYLVGGLVVGSNVII
jgi:hypothetical protein